MDLLLRVWRCAQSVLRPLRAFENERAGRKRFPRHLTVILEPDDLDGGWVAECVQLPGCVAQGETEDEAIANIIDAIGAVITVRMEQQVESTHAVTGPDKSRRLALTV